jgi:hypothetical protein
MYSEYSYVRVDKVRLVSDQFSGGLRASRFIPACQIILTTCTSMACDAATPSMGGLSVIKPNRSNLGEKTPRLILGPFRFGNHDCKPNAQVSNIQPALGNIETEHQPNR